MEFLKSISGRIVTGLVALGVVAAAISWWQMDQSTRQTLVAGTGRILAWLGVMLAWPWVSFAIIARVAQIGKQFRRRSAGRSLHPRGGCPAGMAISLASAERHGLDFSPPRRAGAGVYNILDLRLDRGEGVKNHASSGSTGR